VTWGFWVEFWRGFHPILYLLGLWVLVAVIDTLIKIRRDRVARSNSERGKR
jgi:hypothetical protein